MLYWNVNVTVIHFLGMIITPKFSDKAISKLFVEKVVDGGPAHIHGKIDED